MGLAPMVAASSIRQGLAFFVVGRALSGALGVVWLGMLVRGLANEQLGVYFGFVSAFEIVQLATSLGAYSYAQRFVPGAWLAAPRGELTATLLRILAWRLGTLTLAALALALAWPLLVPALGWPASAPSLLACAAYLLAEGGLRIVDVLLDSALQQGTRQLLFMARNLARIAVLAWATHAGATPDAAFVVALEASLAAMLLTTALALLFARLRRLPLRRPAAAAGAGVRRRLAFSLQGYAALALGLLTGMDAIKLIVSHAAGPAALAAFGVAAALVDMVGRHMPAFLFHDFLRAVLTARAGQAGSTGDTLFRVRLLLRINGAVLAAFSAWLAVFGSASVQVFAGSAGLSTAAGYVAALLPLLFVQAFRVMTSLVAHVNTDNRSVLSATLATCPAPLVVLAVAPVLGGGAAVLGAWLLELTYALVLKRRVGLRLDQICGNGRYWWLLLVVALLAGAAGLVLQAAWPGAAGLLAGSVAFVACYLGLLWRWRAFNAPETVALHRLLAAR